MLKLIEEEFIKQLYNLNIKSIKFLSVVYNLIKKNRVLYKRELYYMAVPCFKTQKSVNLLVKKYEKIFNQKLNIKSSLKGLMYGNITINNILIKNKSLIPENIIEATCDRTVIVIEKDTIFDRVIIENTTILCGKGYPCFNTISFLKVIEHKSDIYCLTDFDPHGLHIFLIYKKHIKSIIRIGLSLDDLIYYQIDIKQCIPLSITDKKLLNKLKLTCLKEEALFLEFFNRKMELEIVFSLEKFNFKEYLDRLT